VNFDPKPAESRHVHHDFNTTILGSSRWNVEYGTKTTIIYMQDIAESSQHQNMNCAEQQL